MISVVIPTRNGGEAFHRCLLAIRDQRTHDEVEIVVIDSGSRDRTPELARSLGARVHEIPAREFSHGGTRNLGARLAQGETIVFTVQDALPADDRWLETLTGPLREGGSLAGTYGRQVPQDDAPPYQRLYIDYRYGPQARVQRASRPQELTVASTLFSNVSSAIKRSVLERFPFAEDIVTAEDLEWCGRVLLAGYTVAYVPAAIVRHSHHPALTTVFRRYFDQGAAAKRSFLGDERGSSGQVRGEGLAFVRHELGWLWRNDSRASIPAALAFEAARYLGFKTGVHHRWLPSRLRATLSLVPGHWSRPGERQSSS